MERSPMTYADRLTRLIASSLMEDPLLAVYDVELAILAAAETHAPRDQRHKDDLLGLLEALDQTHMPVFYENPRVPASYQKLRAGTADGFWSKGLPALKKLRAELWQGVLPQ